MGSSLGPKQIVTDGLVLHLDAGNPKSYPGSGTTWKDLGGNGNNGTLVNGPTFNSNLKSFGFDGTNDSVNLPSISLNEEGFSVSFWINASTWYNPSCPCANVSGIFDISTSYTYLAGIYSNTNGPYFTIYNSTTSPYGRAVNFGIGNTTNTWFNLTATYGPSGGPGIMKTYTNGVFVNSIALDTGNSEFTITATPKLAAYIRNCGNCYLQAKIVDLRIYNRPIIAQEILQNYNATKERFTNK